MPQRLAARDAAFSRAVARLFGLKRGGSGGGDETVKEIVSEVAARGEDALLDYTRRFDGLDLAADRLRVSEAEIDAATATCDAAVLQALNLAKERIEAYH